MSDKISAIRVNNFLHLVKEHFGGSINAFAKAHGISSTPYYMILNGNRQFGDKVAKTIERLFSLQPGHLDMEDAGAKYQAITQIPIYSNQLSTTNSDSILEQDIIRFQVIDKIDIQGFGWEEKNLCVLIVQGDGMAPELQNGQKVIVDTSQTEIIDNHIYAISINNNVFIKKMFKELGTGKLIARSENQSYPDKHFNSNDELKIIGRVVYLLGKLL